MWRWSFFCVRELRDIFKPQSTFQLWNRVDPGIRSWKKHSSDWARCQKAIGGISFTKKWRAETLQPGLEFDNFNPRLESSIFKCISWLNGSFFFGGWWSWFSERSSEDLHSNYTKISPLNLPTFFSCLSGSSCQDSAQDVADKVWHLVQPNWRDKDVWASREVHAGVPQLSKDLPDCEADARATGPERVLRRRDLVVQPGPDGRGFLPGVCVCGTPIFCLSRQYFVWTFGQGMQSRITAANVHL